MRTRQIRSIRLRAARLAIAFILLAASSGCDRMPWLPSHAESYEIVVVNATNLPVHLSVIDLDPPHLVVGAADPADVPGRTTMTVVFTGPSATDWALARDNSAFLDRFMIEEAIRVNRQSTCPVREPIRIEITGGSGASVRIVDERTPCPRD